MAPNARSVQFVDVADHAIDAADDVYLSGSFIGTIDIDGHPVTAPTTFAANYLAKLDGETGMAQWAVLLADRTLDLFQDLAVSPDGSAIAVVGSLRTTMNLGGDQLTTFGNDDPALSARTVSPGEVTGDPATPGPATGR